MPLHFPDLGEARLASNGVKEFVEHYDEGRPRRGVGNGPLPMPAERDATGPDLPLRQGEVPRAVGWAVGRALPPRAARVIPDNATTCGRLAWLALLMA